MLAGALQAEVTSSANGHHRRPSSTSRCQHGFSAMTPEPQRAPSPAGHAVAPGWGLTTSSTFQGGAGALGPEATWRTTALTPHAPSHPEGLELSAHPGRPHRVSERQRLTHTSSQSEMHWRVFRLLPQTLRPPSPALCTVPTGPSVWLLAGHHQRGLISGPRRRGVYRPGSSWPARCRLTESFCERSQLPPAALLTPLLSRSSNHSCPSSVLEAQTQ